MKKFIFLTAVVLQASQSMADMTYKCTKQFQTDCFASLKIKDDRNSSWDQWGSCSGSSSLIPAHPGSPLFFKLEDFGDFPNEKYSLSIPLSISLSQRVSHQEVILTHAVDNMIREAQIWICGADI